LESYLNVVLMIGDCLSQEEKSHAIKKAKKMMKKVNQAQESQRELEIKVNKIFSTLEKKAKEVKPRQHTLDHDKKK
jgi:tRNA A22 N-methylase